MKDEEFKKKLDIILKAFYEVDLRIAQYRQGEKIPEEDSKEYSPRANES
jgi:plasmid maintenance system killer protein